MQADELMGLLLEDLTLSAAATVREAVSRCTFNFGRIPHPVPIEFVPLAGFRQQQEAAHTHAGHVHVEHGRERAHGILWRQAVLGLYWLPTPAYPAGRISVEVNAERELQIEVLLAELAHAIDYTVLTEEGRRMIWAAYHQGLDHPSDWFEEAGELDYSDWTGEAFMPGFTLAFSKIVPRFDSFSHPSTPRVVSVIRAVLEPRMVYGYRYSKIFHRATHVSRSSAPNQWPNGADAVAAGYRPCLVCRP